MITTLLSRLPVVLAALCFTLAAVRADDSAKQDELLTTADLQAYYNSPFQMTRQADAKDPALKDGAPVTQLTFSSTGPETRKHLAILMIRKSASADDAKSACDAVRALYGKTPMAFEDAQGIGDHAFWFGRQLNFSKGNLSFILSATGLTEHRDIEQTHAAALALAKKIVERIK